MNTYSGVVTAIASLAVVAPCQGCSNETVPVASKFVNDGKITSYYNEEYGFWIRFPDAFRPVKWTEEGVVVLYRDDNTGANFNIRCSYVAHSTTLEEVYEGNRQGIMIKSTSLVNLRELGAGEMEIGGREAKWMSFQHGPDDQRVATIAYIVMNGPIALMAFGTADAERFADYREAFDRSAESIRFE